MIYVCMCMRVCKIQKMNQATHSVPPWVISVHEKDSMEDLFRKKSLMPKKNTQPMDRPICRNFQSRFGCNLNHCRYQHLPKQPFDGSSNRKAVEKRSHSVMSSIPSKTKGGLESLPPLEYVPESFAMNGPINGPMNGPINGPINGHKRIRYHPSDTPYDEKKMMMPHIPKTQPPSKTPSLTEEWTEGDLEVKRQLNRLVEVKLSDFPPQYDFDPKLKGAFCMGLHELVYLTVGYPIPEKKDQRVNISLCLEFIDDPPVVPNLKTTGNGKPGKKYRNKEILTHTRIEFKDFIMISNVYEWSCHALKRMYEYHTKIMMESKEGPDMYKRVTLVVTEMTKL